MSKRITATSISSGFVSSLVEELIGDAAKQTPSKDIRVLDFGCGTASLLALCTKVVDQQPRKRFEFVGYDPSVDLDAIRETLIYRNAVAKANRNGYRFWITERLPNHADIVFAHFSLHHSLPGDCIRQMYGLRPWVMIIADYDFRTPQVSLEEFLRVFNAAKACREELTRFTEKASGDKNRGEAACWRYHRRFGVQDFLGAIDQAGGTVVQWFDTRNTRFEFERHKFILVAQYAN